MKSTEQIREFRESEEQALNEQYHELMKELFNLRFQSAMAQLSSPARFRQIKREIARLRTVASERNITIR